MDLSNGALVQSTLCKNKILYSLNNIQVRCVLGGL